MPLIRFAEVEIGLGATAACARCERALSAGTPRQLADVRTVLEAIAASWEYGSGPNVTFVGIEPFAHPELPDLIGAAVSVGFRRIRLRTDAGALSLPGNAEGVLGAGVRLIEIALLAGCAEDNDRLSGRPGLFEAALEGARSFSRVAEAAGEHVVVSGRIPLCTHNERFLSDAVGALARIGASAVVIDARCFDGTEHAAIKAALDTATVNAMAGSVLGAVSFPDPYLAAPWRAIEAS